MSLLIGRTYQILASTFAGSPEVPRNFKTVSSRNEISEMK